MLFLIFYLLILSLTTISWFLSLISRFYLWYLHHIQYAGDNVF
jgi:hypothetical protein